MVIISCLSNEYNLYILFKFITLDGGWLINCIAVCFNYCKFVWHNVNYVYFPGEYFFKPRVIRKLVVACVTLLSNYATILIVNLFSNASLNVLNILTKSSI